MVNGKSLKLLWRKYCSCIFFIVIIIIIVGSTIYIQNYLGEHGIIHLNNQTVITQPETSVMNIFSVIYVLIGGIFTLLIYEYRSVKSEEKIFSVLKMDIKTNLDILKFNREKVQFESRFKGINYSPLKLFKTDFWNLINYNSPRKLIDEELYSKINDAVLIMNSFNEISQSREYHKAISEDIIKEEIFAQILFQELDIASEKLSIIKKLID